MEPLESPPTSIGLADSLRGHSGPDPDGHGLFSCARPLRFRFRLGPDGSRGWPGGGRANDGGNPDDGGCRSHPGYRCYPGGPCYPRGRRTSPDGGRNCDPRA
ncbi:hypothetical protein GCM10027038_16610 [Arthrobacter bambusae]